jgi:hypothetical protein
MTLKKGEIHTLADDAKIRQLKEQGLSRVLAPLLLASRGASRVSLSSKRSLQIPHSVGGLHSLTHRRDSRKPTKIPRERKREG